VEAYILRLLSDLAALCNRAYSEKTFASEDVEVLYRNVDGRHVYAIRGTETQLFTRGGIIDLIRGALFFRRGKMDAHFGFVDGWRAIKSELLEHYNRQEAGPLYLTGHSMGGAIAIVGTLDLLRDDFPHYSLGCVSFGSPRCIDLDDISQSESAAMSHCCMDIVNTRDPIPSLFRFAGYDWGYGPFYIGGKDRAAWYRMRMKYHDIDEYRKILFDMGH
jgi:hypothetical protein